MTDADLLAGAEPTSWKVFSSPHMLLMTDKTSDYVPDELTLTKRGRHVYCLRTKGMLADAFLGNQCSSSTLL